MTEVYWGDSPARQATEGGEGKLVVRDGEPFYKIENYHTIPAFFMTVVSGSDHWMFVSSTGGLTCGRGNADNALFPYYTDDKIHDSFSTTGPQTMLLVEKAGKTLLWKPFGEDASVYRVERNLYKNYPGNKLIFEEINHDLGLVFSYCWSNSERYGFVRTSTLVNSGNADLQVHVLDGLRNVLPHGVTSKLQTEMSTLVDAYKQAESFPNHGLAIYTMSSILTDRAEPSEALKATVIWSTGLENPGLLLSEDQVGAFCNGTPPAAESISHGKRGAFFVHSSFVIPSDQKKHWMILADINQDSADISALLGAIGRGIPASMIEQDIETGSQRLLQLVGSADGFQLSIDTLATGRHFSNTLFNIMRGGTYYDEYCFPLSDFLSFAGAWNQPLRNQFEDLLDPGSEPHDLTSVLAIARNSGNADMERIALEYLPLTFSRRHGDPSRPWNRFSIDIKNPDGSDKLYYEGNWRDIFQNWEALSISYPEFAESIICKFVNASTADGYNPYRITKDGFEWEVLDPENPWSNIGYWGDHQVNYSLKLIELSCRYHPGRIRDYLGREVFVYADVPYRLKAYQSILEDPRNSLVYDNKRAVEIEAWVARLGNDGKLLRLPDGSIYKVNLMEKLLVTTLSKLSNFVPGGGIWMNTQRPEWNDANNALAGFGLSMVTLCYLRRFLVSLEDLLDENVAEKFSISDEVLSLFDATETVFEKYTYLLETSIGAQDRKAIMDELGQLGETYRESIYSGFSGHKNDLGKKRLLDFVRQVKAFMDHSIRLSRRPDGLYHAYNLIRIEADAYAVDKLPEMLEGQVAVLSSGYLDAKGSLDLLKALRSSRLYRADQNSYLLYPDRKLPCFLEKNVIQPALVESSSLIQNELKSGRKDFIQEDVNGIVHFNGNFKNAGELRKGLEEDITISDQDRDALCAIYETVFNHHQFTGRSGAMFKYEGLGCIYWHMVSKLLLATTEVICTASDKGVGQEVMEQLCIRFDDIKEGLGLHKPPSLYGAFPVDPYSHTTGFSGVQQPGMTGQVKEDLISRFAELGVVVSNGEISFAPVLLKRDEFIADPQTWHYSVGGPLQSENLDSGCMAFSLCGVPVIYRLADESGIQVFLQDDETILISGNGLGLEWSQSLFKREKRVQKIVVDLPATQLRYESNVPQ